MLLNLYQSVDFATPQAITWIHNVMQHCSFCPHSPCTIFSPHATNHAMLSSSCMTLLFHLRVIHRQHTNDNISFYSAQGSDQNPAHHPLLPLLTNIYFTKYWSGHLRTLPFPLMCILPLFATWIPHSIHGPHTMHSHSIVWKWCASPYSLYSYQLIRCIQYYEPSNILECF